MTAWHTIWVLHGRFPNQMDEIGPGAPLSRGGPGQSDYQCDRADN